MAETDEDVRLPENAFRPLAEGERYEPVVPADSEVPEVTARSIAQGFLWSIVFSAAATYIALKLGQGIESAIPISILAVGLSVLAVKVLRSRASTLLENIVDPDVLFPHHLAVHVSREREVLYNGF